MSDGYNIFNYTSHGKVDITDIGEWNISTKLPRCISSISTPKVNEILLTTYKLSSL